MCSNQQPQSTGTDQASSATVASSTPANATAVTSTPAVTAAAAASAAAAATATDANTLISLADYQHRLHQLYAQQAFRAATVAAAATNALSPASASGHHFFSTASGHSFDSAAAAAATFAHHLSPFTARYVHDSRYRIEEPKPSCSYIGLIAMAIISSPERKMVLSDIYQHILDHYPYFRNRGPGWRNSIRHNLSLNDCFIKSGRSANGKGHYWAIHPANIDDFMKGDFRRRKAQRKVRKHLGLSVPDDEDSDSPAPTPPTLTPNGNTLNHLHPAPLPPPPHHATTSSSTGSSTSSASSVATSNNSVRHMMQLSPHSITSNNCLNVLAGFTYPSSSRTPPSGMFKPDSLFESLSNHLSMLPPTHRTSKRLFDVESLLAPDLSNHHHHHHHSSHHHAQETTSANHRTSEQSNNNLNHNHNNNNSSSNNNNNSSSNKLNDSSAHSISPTQSLDEHIHNLNHHHHHHHHANHMMHSSKVLTGDSTSPTHSLADYRQSDSASSSCSSPSVTLSSASPPPATPSSSSLANLASINCHSLPNNGHHAFNSSAMSNPNPAALLDATNLANVWLQSPAIQSLTNLQQVNAAAAAAAMAGLINTANSVNSLSSSPNVTNGNGMSAAAAAAAAWTSATAAVASLSQHHHQHHHLQHHSNSLSTPLSSYSPSPPHVSSHNGKSATSSPK